jgi:hypothetical protein
MGTPALGLCHTSLYPVLWHRAPRLSVSPHNDYLHWALSAVRREFAIFPLPCLLHAILSELHTRIYLYIAHVRLFAFPANVKSCLSMSWTIHKETRLPAQGFFPWAFRLCVENSVFPLRSLLHAILNELYTATCNTGIYLSPDVVQGRFYLASLESVLHSFPIT